MNLDWLASVTAGLKRVVAALARPTRRASRGKLIPRQARRWGLLFDRETYSWQAVLAGVVAALIVQVMLTMLGLGIGFLSVDAPTASTAPRGVSWAAFIYWAIGGIIAAFVGGWVAGAVAALAPAPPTRYRLGRSQH